MLCTNSLSTVQWWSQECYFTKQDLATAVSRSNTTPMGELPSSEQLPTTALTATIPYPVSSFSNAELYKSSDSGTQSVYSQACSIPCGGPSNSYPL